MYKPLERLPALKLQDHFLLEYPALGNLTPINTYALQTSSKRASQTPIPQLDPGDDYAGDITTNGLATIGDTINGVLEVTDDTDWFRIELGETQSIILSVINGPIDFLAVYDLNGTLITEQFAVEELFFLSEFSDTYYIEVRGDTVSTGAYSFSVMAGAGADDYSADTSTTGMVEVGGSASGSLETPDDNDWFRVELTAGQQIRIDSDHITIASIIIYDENEQAELISSFFEEVFFTATTTGTHYIAIQGDGIANGAYTFNIVAVDNEVPGDTSTTETISVGDTITSIIEATPDRDWFSFTAQAGDDVIFVLENTNIQDIVLRIRDASGNIISEINSASAILPILEISATLANTATYFIEVDADYNAIADTSYTLSFVDTQDDFSADTTSSATLILDTAIAARLETTGDSDWFQFEVQPSTHISFLMQDIAAPFYDIVFHDTDGNILDIDFHILTDGPRGHIVALDEELTGLFFIEVASTSAAPSNRDYRITLEESTLDLAGDSTTTGAIDLTGAPVSGRIEVLGDSDWFRFTGEANDQMSIVVDTTVTGPLSLLVRDENGDHVNFHYSVTSDTNQTQITFTPSADGEYFLEVYGDRDTGAYSVSNLIYTDDHLSSPQTTSFLTFGTPVTGEFEVNGDSDWFGFAAEAGDLIEFNITNTVYPRPQFAFRDQQGDYTENTYTIIGNQDGSSTVFFQATATGNYFLSLSDADVQSYQITMQESRDDYSANIHTLGTISTSTSAIGVLDFKNDVDWYAFTANEDDIFKFITENDNIELTLYDAQGVVLNDILLNSSVASINNSSGNQFHAGQYFLAVTHTYSNLPFSSIDFSIDIEVVQDDYSGSTSTSGLIGPNQSITGSVDVSGDRDWFAFDAVAGNAVYFLLSDVANSRDFTISVFDENGNLIISDTNVLKADILLEVDTTGTYYVEVQASAFDTPAGQTYTLTREDYLDDYGGNTSSTGHMSLTDRATGTLNRHDDTDWFVFDAQVGDIFMFQDFVGRGANSLQLVLYDSNGVEQIVYIGQPIEVLVSGEYYLSVGHEGFTPLEAPISYSINMYNPTNTAPINAEDNIYMGVAGANNYVIYDKFENHDSYIFDFEDGVDIIEFANGIYDFSHLKFFQVDNDVIIASSEGFFVIVDTHISMFDSSDFLFRISSSNEEKNTKNTSNNIDQIMNEAFSNVAEFSISSQITALNEVDDIPNITDTPQNEIGNIDVFIEDNELYTPLL